MPTYHTYDPAKDKLEKGTKIRLGGRKGCIILSEKEGWPTPKVEWEDGSRIPVDLKMFPALEVADAPLTISNRLKEEIKSVLKEKCKPGISFYGDPIVNLSEFNSWLGSLEVTD